jgi:tetratricopeptide (TPR) repeat protein
MQFSQESYRTRWLALVAAWAIAAFTVFTQANSVRQYLGVVGQLGTRGAPTVATPMQQMYPAFAADAQTWVRHALSLVEGNSVRLRYTSIDNAPDGREVHWNSAWAWSIAGAGWIGHLFTGTPLPAAIERATVWLNPIAFLSLIAILSAWATQRAGLLAGLFVVAAMVGNDRIYEGFFPTYTDHHGLLTVSVFGLTLGAVLMGAGWWQPANKWMPVLPTSAAAAQRAAVFSGLSGAFGLWVSAASVIPAIVLVATSGAIAALAQGRNAQQQGATFDPAAWRTWGRVGAGASVVFYLLEYFPNHLAFRLEANHPVHALAWLGGSELIAQILQAWLAPAASRRFDVRRLVAAGLAVSVAPFLFLLLGHKVFVVVHPFMSRLHHDYIQEFLPIWRTIQGFDARLAFQVLVVDVAPLIAGIATLSFLRRESPVILWFATVAAFFFTALAWWQSRWLLNACGVQICVALVVLACWTRSWTPAARWGLAGVVVSVLYVPTAVIRYLNSTEATEKRQVSQGDANNALARDIAARLRATQPQGDLVVLASPNASTSIGYYGRFKTLGTLYWENLDGLQAAGAIFSAGNERQAATLIRAHKVTHIAIVSQENFIQQYYELLNPKTANSTDLQQSFGVKLFYNRVIPQWLEIIPYKVPDDLAVLKANVLLLKVNFKQSLGDAIYNVAMSQVENGDIADAERNFDLLIKQLPQAHQPYLRKGEILANRRDWAASAEFLLRGIALAPAHERGQLYTTYGKPFYDAKQYAFAIRFYRAAVADQKTADAACYLAWVLATSPENSVRNGAEALALAEQVVQLDPTSPTYLSALAAAYAETGRFKEAVEAGERALANSRLRNEAANIQQIFAQRLATLREGRPLRVEP